MHEFFDNSQQMFLKDIVARKVLFVDWHNTLCNQRFFHEILSCRRSPDRKELEAQMDNIFSDLTLTLKWMRGGITTNSLLSARDMPDRKGRSETFWTKKLIKSCKTMNPNLEMISELAKLPSDIGLVLATDNMDCFVEAQLSIKNKLPMFIGAISSSKVNVVKSEDPVKFFGDFLESIGLSFTDCGLLDDSTTNCELFAEYGGNSWQWEGDTKLFSSINKWAQA